MVVAVVPLCAGCGGNGGGDYTRSGPPIPQPPGWPSGLRGTFAAHIKAQAEAGTWQLEMSPGHYVAVSPKGARHGGSAVASRTGLYLQDDASCPGPGVYYWDRAGQRLTLTKITDTCAGRIFALTGAPWTLTTPAPAHSGGRSPDGA